MLRLNMICLITFQSIFFFLNFHLLSVIVWQSENALYMSFWQALDYRQEIVVPRSTYSRLFLKFRKGDPSSNYFSVAFWYAYQIIYQSAAMLVKYVIESR